MFSRVLAIGSLLFLEVSSTLDSSYFNLEEPDYSYSLYQDIMDIFTTSPYTSQAIELLNDNLEEFQLPIKRLHEDGVALVIGQNESRLAYSSFIEINCGQCTTGGILDDILSRVIDSYIIFVILKDSQDLNFDEIEVCMLEVFEKFWKLLITDVAVLFSSNYNRITVEGTSTMLKNFAYVYEPYNEKPLRQVTGLSYHNIFYDKTANFHLHPIKVLAHERYRFNLRIQDGTRQLSGTDGSFTEILDQIFNATVIIYFRNDLKAGMRDTDIHEYREHLRNRSSDVWMNIRIMDPEVYRGVVYSYPRDRMDIICILPRFGGGHVKYRNIVGGKVLYLLLTMVIVFAIASLLVFLMEKMSLRRVPILKLAKVVLNQSDVVTQKMTSTTMRILFGFWLVGSLVWSTTLQTFITSRIIRPSVEDKMTTIRDVINSGIYLRIERTYWALTKNHYDQRLLIAMKNNVIVVSDGDLFDGSAVDVGYLAPQDVIEIDGKASRAYVLQETFLPNLAAYYFTEKSPLIRRFNKALAIITESGIMQKWATSNDYQIKSKLKIDKPLIPVKYITSKHLKSAIYFYGTGMLIAFAIFICEVKIRWVVESMHE